MADCEYICKFGDDNFVICHVDESDQKSLNVALRRTIFERSQFIEKNGGFYLSGMDGSIALFAGARDIESGLMNDCQPSLP